MSGRGFSRIRCPIETTFVETDSQPETVGDGTNISLDISGDMMGDFSQVAGVATGDSDRRLTARQVSYTMATFDHNAKQTHCPVAELIFQLSFASFG